jgi:hypothetical protein
MKKKMKMKTSWMNVSRKKQQPCVYYDRDAGLTAGLGDVMIT